MLARTMYFKYGVSLKSEKAEGKSQTKVGIKQHAEICSGLKFVAFRVAAVSILRQKNYG